MTTVSTHSEGDSLDRMLADTRALVECESPSTDRAAVREVASLADRILRSDGHSPELIEIDGWTHVRLVAGLGEGPRVLLLGHLDTVWPLGTLRTHPFGVHDGLLRGPGCFDMKAGAALAFEALRRVGPQANLTLLLTGDEEVGATTSRALVEQTARSATAVLVLEASAPGGALKTRRKGVSEYHVTAEGRAAHAGLEPENGLNATLELAHAAIEIAGFADAAAGTTVTPTRLHSGTTLNTVPALGTLSVDARAWTVDEQLRVDALMRDLSNRSHGARLSIKGGPGRLPLEAEASEDLFRKAALAARSLGQAEPEEAHVGGGSDGNFTAAIGIPTLDGLGAVGGGAHADDEHVVVDALPPRADLIERIVRDVLANGLGQPRRHGRTTTRILV